MYRLKLLELGIAADTLGFEYLNYALEIYRPMDKLMIVYEAVAQQFGTTHQNVERAMCHAIKKVSNLTLGQFIAKYKILWG